jgi:hypothetical protein
VRVKPRAIPSLQTCSQSARPHARAQSLLAPRPTRPAPAGMDAASKTQTMQTAPLTASCARQIHLRGTSGASAPTPSAVRVTHCLDRALRTSATRRRRGITQRASAYLQDLACAQRRRLLLVRFAQQDAITQPVSSGPATEQPVALESTSWHERRRTHTHSCLEWVGVLIHTIAKAPPEDLRSGRCRSYERCAATTPTVLRLRFGMIQVAIVRCTPPLTAPEAVKTRRGSITRHQSSVLVVQVCTRVA